MGNKDFSAVLIDTDEHELGELAVRFRAAIMQCEPEILPFSFLEFPRGACGDASLLLAKYLEENEKGKFQYILGNREGKSHAWLQRDELLIDITASQFNDQEASVIVTKDHSWHSSFLIESSSVADFSGYDPLTANAMLKAYKIIKSKIGIEHPLALDTQQTACQ